MLFVVEKDITRAQIVLLVAEKHKTLEQIVLYNVVEGITLTHCMVNSDKMMHLVIIRSLIKNGGNSSSSLKNKQIHSKSICYESVYRSDAIQIG